MRIVAGKFAGRHLTSPNDFRVRPTGETVRVALMRLLRNDLEGARIIDLFAGTGALGLEALSRGAAFVDFVEQSPMTLMALGENVATLGAGPRCEIHRGDALAWPARVVSRGVRYDVAFADPPYHKDLAVEIATCWLAGPFATIFGVEHEATTTLPEGGDVRRYGDTAITIYRTP